MTEPAQDHPPPILPSDTDRQWMVPAETDDGKSHANRMLEDVVGFVANGRPLDTRAVADIEHASARRTQNLDIVGHSLLAARIQNLSGLVQASSRIQTALFDPDRVSNATTRELVAMFEQARREGADIMSFMATLREQEAPRVVVDNRSINIKTSPGMDEGGDFAARERETLRMTLTTILQEIQRTQGRTPDVLYDQLDPA